MPEDPKEITVEKVVIDSYHWPHGHYTPICVGSGYGIIVYIMSNKLEYESKEWLTVNIIVRGLFKNYLVHMN
jgi:hypothetical protein